MAEVSGVEEEERLWGACPALVTAWFPLQAEDVT